MIRIFSRLRRKFLANNMFSKYLLYGVGEILLVVIGILIALQVDNWNEERILRKKERLYLTEILSNLQDDLAKVSSSIDFNKKKDSSMHASLTTMLSAESDGEAMQQIIRNMPVLTEYRVFTQNRVAFDNMLSAENIDMISEKSLRTDLSTYYAEQNLLEGTQERVKELTRIFVNNVTPLMMNREVLQMFFEGENTFPSGDDLNFKNNRVLFGDIFGMQRTGESHTEYLSEYQKTIEGLIEDITEFLGPAR